MAKRKKAPQGIAVHSEEQATQVAKKNARWKGVPPAYQEPPEGEDSHERLDLLSQQEQLDVKAFQQGDMQKCYVGLAIEQEDKEEQSAAQQYS